MRLFLAILLNEPVRKALEAVQEDLIACGAKGRFSRPENLHLTLAFLGELPRSSLPKIETCMAEAATGLPLPAVLSFAALDRFRRRDGDLYYVQAAASPWLLQLQRQLTRALDRAGLPYDKKPFRPHLTLGRNIVFPPGVSPPSIRHAVPDLPVASIALMESRRVNGVLTYTPCHRARLSGATG
ncbi:MAG: RNA 2',3'-cyclic phosphodiesterase [Oscillospiraceae bacterium]|nr:RNA 2',3'-cyclic phosphodiesterase [Oscillospiraceae bacterium]